MPATIDYAATRPPKRGAMRGVILGGLLALGVQLWLLTDPGLVRTPTFLLAIAAGLLICLVPAVRVAIAHVGGWLDRRGPMATPARFLLVALASGALLYAMAVVLRRPFLPAVQDEFSYLLQTRMVAEGRLWLPSHPLAEFFDTFYVITDRAYASQYFPGAAMFYASGVWLGLPFWTMPLAVTALACGAIFLLLRELFDGAAALAGVALTCGVLGLRYVSVSVFAQQPTLLLGTLALWAVLRWDRTRGIGFLVGAGLAIGACAITRPLDAAVFGACAAALVAWRLRREPWPAWRRVAIAGLVPLVPFVALQLVVNRGVTGRWLETPFTYYAERDMPGSGLGFRAFDPAAKPESALPQKQRFYAHRIGPLLQKHTVAATLDEWRSRLFKNLAVELLADGLLMIVVPASLLALRDARRAIVVAVLPLWWLAYLLHPFTFFHYYVVLLPSTAVLIFAGVDAIARGVPTRARPFARAAGVLVPAVAAALALPTFRRDVVDQVITNPTERRLRAFIDAAIEPRLLVIVRDDPTQSAEQEVVYNVDRARIDDNRVVRSHDLGDARNVALYRYYAERQPDRVVYRFDRSTGAFARLGDVVTLSRPADATTRP